MAWLGAIVGGIVAVRRAVLARQTTPRVGPVPTWPPLERGEAPVAAVGDLVTSEQTTVHHDAPPATLAAVVAEGVIPDPEDPTPPVAGDSPWVPAEAGSCPLSHPVKANDNSMIFHAPGGRFYDRTRAERCYVDAAAAEADGYRAAKGS
ncbi:MAG: hypothetical protein ACRDZ2_02340 [Ilumatobacteraceae bacterium]